jgi:hypothetical protein
VLAAGQRRAHYLAINGRRRTAETLVRTAVGARFMVRMGSPVRFRRGLHHKPAAQARCNSRPVARPRAGNRVCQSICQTELYVWSRSASPAEATPGRAWRLLVWRSTPSRAAVAGSSVPRGCGSASPLAQWQGSWPIAVANVYGGPCGSERLGERCSQASELTARARHVAAYRALRDCGRWPPAVPPLPTISE